LSRAPLVEGRPARIGVVGTGFISRSLVRALQGPRCADLEVVRVLTRRDPHTVDHPAADRLTRSIDGLVEGCDLVFECSGDPFHATAVVARAFEAGRPVVTLDVEFHVTTGPHFVGRGLVTEAEGDQPGVLAALRERVLDMGFEPLVYGNMKGFLNHDPTPQDMSHWARRQGLSLAQTVAATDGTKIQIEQALVANAFGATVSCRGMEGWARDDTERAAQDLARLADLQVGAPIADFLVSRTQVPGVFIAGTHDPAQAEALRYYKLGEGPYYVVTNPQHLVTLEAVRTVRRVLRGEGALIHNTARPTVSVAAVAKRRLLPGTRIERGIGGFEVRGEAVRVDEAPGHVPIGVLQPAVLRRTVEAGEVLQWDDVELPDSAVVDIVRALCAPGLNTSVAAP
jgi:predicted homoserine dehydrogenase-like protein